MSKADLPSAVTELSFSWEREMVSREANEAHHGLQEWHQSWLRGPFRSGAEGPGWDDSKAWLLLCPWCFLVGRDEIGKVSRES